MANRNRRIQRDCKQQFAEQNNTNNVEQIDESPDETESKKRGKVSEIILSKRLRNRTELLVFSNQQRPEGKTDLAEFIVNRGKKVVNEVIATAWEMESAQKTQERQSKSRIEVLHDAYQQKCTSNMDNEWHNCALQLLANNNIDCCWKFCRLYQRPVAVGSSGILC